MKLANGRLRVLFAKKRYTYLKMKDGVLYIPVDATKEQYKHIAKFFKVDPYAKFLVCENCMQGHYGAVPGLTADNWISGQWNTYIAKEQQGNKILNCYLCCSKSISFTRKRKHSIKRKRLP